MSESSRHDSAFVSKSFLAGGVAGMTSKTAVAPLDRIKILLQAHHNHYKHHGVVSGLRGIIEKESFLALYKGNGAQMVRIFPYAAVQFLSFEIYKKFLTDSIGKRYNLNHGLKFISGASAGVTAAMATYPLDLVRARLAFHVALPVEREGSVMLTPKRYSIASTLFNVVRNEGGILALYKGLTPTLIAMVPYAGLSFYCFERFKYTCLHYFPTRCGHQKNEKWILNVPTKLLCGGVAGAVAQTFSYPLDVARRRMQLSMMSPETQKYSKGLLSTLTLTYREHGVTKGLYRGMSVNYLRAIPMVAVSFSTYELMKQALGLDTGIEA